MLKILIFSGLFLVMGAATAQDIALIKIADLEKIVEEKSEKIKVINFWATWCKPCVAEMPQFEALKTNKEFENVEILLVSVDFAQDVGKVKRFIAKKQLKNTVVLLNETDANAWIDRVEPTWGGAIPATLLVDSKTNRRLFLEKEFHQNELEEAVRKFINQQ
jgi:thiol-disulfide isomerase/thioredoxin